MTKRLYLLKSKSARSDKAFGGHMTSLMDCLEQLRVCLWLGTTVSGLCRYDGVEFIIYTTDNGLADNFVPTICEDRRGRLWFGAGGHATTKSDVSHTTGSGVSCFDGRDFTTYTIEDGLLDNRVTNIIRDREGQLWFAHLHSGLTRLDLETLDLVTTEAVNTLVFQDGQGGIWFNHGKELCYLKERWRLRRLRQRWRSGSIRGKVWLQPVLPQQWWSAGGNQALHMYITK